MGEPTETVPPTPNDGSGMVLWEIVALIKSENRDADLFEIAKTIRLRQ